MEVIDNKYRLENVKLGTGGFSEVFLGTNIVTDQKVAIKRIPLTQKQNVLEKISLEIDLMQKMDHVNIVTYYDVVRTNNYWYIIMEYCDAGTLEDVIRFNDRMAKKKSANFNREANVYYYLNQLKEALSYIRKRGLIHRDIKPSNVLLTKTAKNMCTSFGESDTIFKCDKDEQPNYYFTEKIIVKLADFGLAKEYGEDENRMLHTICGSPLYMAPELLFDMRYNSKADLWSYGIIMYEMLFGTHPNCASSLEKLKQNLRLREIDFHLAENFTPYCFDILARLLTKDPRMRIEWEDFFNHKWFAFWKNLYDREGDLIVKNVNILKMESRKISTSPLSLGNSPSCSPLGYSNLSRMKFSTYDPNIKMGTYRDYPSSYPPNRINSSSNHLCISGENINLSTDRIFRSFDRSNNKPLYITSQPIPIKKDNSTTT
ncbi:MAG: protein kinase [Nitrososphaerota archaeon]